MAKLDLIHNAVKNALIKDGWNITADPFTIEYEDVNVYADLAAERPIAAEKAGQKIAVEIKSFIGRSPIRDLEVALGQFTLYRHLLDAIEPERKLYLAISQAVYADLFSLKAVQFIVDRTQLSMVIIDLITEEIVIWTN